MTQYDEPFDRLVRPWFATATSESGVAEVHASAMAAVAHRRQRPGWLLALRGRSWDGSPRASGRATAVSGRLLVAGLAALLIVLIAVLLAGGSRRPDRGIVPPAVTPSAVRSAAPAESVVPSGPTPTPRATPRLDMPAPSPLGRNGTIDPAFFAFLDRQGERMTPVPAAIPDGAVFNTLNRIYQDAGLSIPQDAIAYGIVTCIDPSKGCPIVGSATLGAERGVWFQWRITSGAGYETGKGLAVRAIDAVTLEHILVNGY